MSADKDPAALIAETRAHYGTFRFLGLYCLFDGHSLVGLKLSAALRHDPTRETGCVCRICGRYYPPRPKIRRRKIKV